MLKNMTISGKTNLITEILAAAVWLIAVASAGLDRQDCWRFLVSLADSGSDLRLAVDANQQKNLKKRRNKNWLEEDALVCRNVCGKFGYCCVSCHCGIGWRRGADKYG